MVRLRLRIPSDRSEKHVEMDGMACILREWVVAPHLTTSQSRHFRLELTASVTPRCDYHVCHAVYPSRAAPSTAFFPIS